MHGSLHHYEYANSNFLTLTGKTRSIVRLRVFSVIGSILFQSAAVNCQRRINRSIVCGRTDTERQEQ